MSTSTINSERDERQVRPALRALADRAFSRAAGAPLIGGNCVRLLKDAQENYPAWLEAISAAKRHVHFESYIIHEDDTGREFAEALIAKARERARAAYLRLDGRLWESLSAVLDTFGDGWCRCALL
jgi:cardiolipin synthase